MRIRDRIRHRLMGHEWRADYRNDKCANCHCGDSLPIAAICQSCWHQIAVAIAVDFQGREYRACTDCWTQSGHSYLRGIKE